MTSIWLADCFMSFSAVHVSVMTKSSVSFLSLRLRCKTTCSHFYGLINKTAEQSMKTASFSALSLPLALVVCLLLCCQRQLPFVCVHIIFCVRLLISGHLFRNTLAGRRGRGVCCLQVSPLGGWEDGVDDCQLPHHVWFDSRETLRLWLLSRTQQMLRREKGGFLLSCLSWQMEYSNCLLP